MSKDASHDAKRARHEIVQDIKRIAFSLGATPSRDAYYSNGGRYSERQIRQIFGGWSPAVQAAGLTPAEEKKTKLTNEDVFGKDIHEHLEEYRKLKQAARKVIKRTPTLVVGDTHFPFTNMKTLQEIIAFAKFSKPKRIIQTGDLHDLFSWSKFPASRNIYTPRQEIELAYDMATEFWSKIKEAVPGADCIQLLGNHDVRPMKRLMECYPAGEDFHKLDAYFRFKGVATNYDYRQEIILDDVVYHHGYKSGLGQHRDHNLMNSVVGHTHQGGVVFREVRFETLWELNAGYCGDPESKALSYTSQKIVKWTQGCGYIDTYGPRFIPL